MPLPALIEVSRTGGFARAVARNLVTAGEPQNGCAASLGVGGLGRTSDYEGATINWTQLLALLDLVFLSSDHFENTPSGFERRSYIATI